MALLGPPLITSPRAVKRLTNSYGVLTAIRRRNPDGTRAELAASTTVSAANPRETPT